MITPLRNSALNKLFLAINHYVSTGDHIGEGTAVPHGPQKSRTGEPADGDRIMILVFVNRTDEVDLKDFTCFRSRFSELESEFNVKLKNDGTEQQFQRWSFVIYYRQALPLAKALAEKPGSAGWGSLKKIIDQHNITI